jgi:hypothetical protein
MFSFAAWKQDGDAVRNSEMLLSRAIPNASDFQYKLTNYSYHRFRVLLSNDGTRAIVLEGVDASDCPQDLADTAKSFLNPVAVAHVRFGTLTLNRGLKLFFGNTKWNKLDVQVSITADREEFQAEAVRLAEKLIDHEREIGSRVSKFVVESVLAEYEYEDLDAQDLRSRLVLEGLHFSETGCVEFWFTDGGLWGDHSLVIRMDTDEQMSFSVEG